MASSIPYGRLSLQAIYHCSKTHSAADSAARPGMLPQTSQTLLISIPASIALWNKADRRLSPAVGTGRGGGARGGGGGGGKYTFEHEVWTHALGNFRCLCHPLNLHCKLGSLPTDGDEQHGRKGHIFCRPILGSKDKPVHCEADSTVHLEVLAKAPKARVKLLQSLMVCR